MLAITSYLPHLQKSSTKERGDCSMSEMVAAAAKIAIRCVPSTLALERKERAPIEGDQETEDPSALNLESCAENRTSKFQ